MYQRILVPVDSSTTKQAILTEAARFAKLCPNATIRLIHVIDLAQAATGGSEFVNLPNVTELEEQIKNIGQDVLSSVGAAARMAGFEPEACLVETWGEPLAESIVDEAKSWGADIILMGTHGYSGLSHILMGSVAEGVVRHALSPVLLVRTQS